jgi:serpin B
MKLINRPKAMLVGLATAGLALAGCGPATQPSTFVPDGKPAIKLTQLDASEQPPAGTEPINWFGERLFPLLQEANPDQVNPVYSPLSVYLALAMAAEGARGNTAEQFADLLEADQATVNQAAGALLADYAEPGDPNWPNSTINLANSVWIDQGFPVEPNYLAAMEEFYDSQAVEADLQLPATVDQINQWVSDQTKGLIDQIMEPRDTNDVVLCLINALYFKGTWATPAFPENTAPTDFASPSGTVQAETMTFKDTSGSYLLLDDGTEGAVMPYNTGRFAMLAVMPAGGPAAVNWDGATLASWLEAAQSKDRVLTVKLPKWEVNSGTLDLIPILRAAGLTDAFDDTVADFSGISPGAPVIDQVKHRAVIKVDENGTEAAAVTEVAFLESMPMDEPVTVNFDRPFIYSIIDTETGLPLFIGLINDPTAA